MYVTELLVKKFMYVVASESSNVLQDEAVLRQLLITNESAGG